MKSIITTLMAVSLLAHTSMANACGESLYRVGKGVSYRAYSAPLPANLLVFADSERARQVAAELAKAGHGVQVVQDTGELETELRKGGYDVVIAPSAQRETVESLASSGASFLAVGSGGADGRELAPDDDIKQYLKAIHKSLKQKA